jgi:hypothetical protein
MRHQRRHRPQAHPWSAETVSADPAASWKGSQLVLTTSTSNTVIVAAGAATVKQRILNIMLMASAAVTVQFMSFDGLSTYTPISGKKYLAANSGFAYSFESVGTMDDSLPGQSIVVNLSSAVEVSMDYRSTPILR